MKTALILLSLLVNSALIYGTGVYEFVNPPAYAVVLYRLPASIWWGAMLLCAGIAYCYRFAPSLVARRNASPN
jgi:hypothetical protein